MDIYINYVPDYIAITIVMTIVYLRSIFHSTERVHYIVQKLVHIQKLTKLSLKGQKDNTNQYTQHQIQNTKPVFDFGS